MKQIILYLIFGGLTTLVNAIVHFAASWGLGLPAWLSAVLAWIFAVSFAFVTNKFFVFNDKNDPADKSTNKKRTGKQAALFFGMRLATLIINAAIMLIFVDILDFNEPIIFVIGQIVVLTLNYLASKLLIFKQEVDD
jgi:putative flippase GtrA